MVQCRVKADGSRLWIKLNSEEPTTIIAVLSYNDSACIKCNFPLEYMFTCAKWDNDTACKNTVKPFPPWGVRQIH